MPKRIISDVTWKSKKVRNIQPVSFRPEYAWFMPFVQDNGVFERDADILWAEAYAVARPDWTPEMVEQLLVEFERVGLLKSYEVDGKVYCWLVGSDKSGHLPPPSQRYGSLPLPPDYCAPTVAVPPKYRKDRATLEQPYGNPMATLGASYGTPTPGIGSGIGIGIGIGIGKGQPAAGQHDFDIPEKDSRENPAPLDEEFVEDEESF